MGAPTTKIELLDLLKSRRNDFDAAVAAIPQSSMLEPSAAGYWSVKDIIAHLAYYEGWMADRLQEQLEGKTYTPTQLDMMHWEPRNTIIYEQNKSRTLNDVLKSSKATFDRLVTAVDESERDAAGVLSQQFPHDDRDVAPFGVLREIAGEEQQRARMACEKFLQAGAAHDLAGRVRGQLLDQ